MMSGRWQVEIGMISLFLNVTLTLVSLLGIFFNGYIVTAVLLTKQIASANNILLLHLGAINTLLGLFSLIFSVPGYSPSEWFQGLPCILHGFFHTFLHSLVLWTICGLNCDRFYAIAAPLHYGNIVNSKKVLTGLGTGWVISLIFCVPTLFITPNKDLSELSICITTFSFNTGAVWYSTFYTTFTLLLPTTLIICCNIKILMIASYHRHRIASAIYEVTLSAQVTITHQRNPFFVPIVTAPGSVIPKFRGRSAISTIFQLVGSLILIYFPYYIILMWKSITNHFTTTKIHPYFFTTITALLMCSPPINGFLYGVKNKSIKKAFQNYWRKKQTKSEVNHEIQARTPSTCGSRRPSFTPLAGMGSRPNLQRRLSEALLEMHRGSSKQKLTRIATDLTWRPASATSLQLSPKDEGNSIKHTASCNTLRVPICDDVVTETPTPPRLFLQKIFGGERKKRILDDVPAAPKSPRITITRAFSEENDSPPNKVVMTKRHSTSTTLLEKKWRQLKENDRIMENIKPLLDDSDSSESGKLFINTEEKSQSTEEETLELWTSNRSNKFKGESSDLIKIQSQQEIILK